MANSILNQDLEVEDFDPEAEVQAKIWNTFMRADSESIASGAGGLMASTSGFTTHRASVKRRETEKGRFMTPSAGFFRGGTMTGMEDKPSGIN